jgi:alanine racemase
MMDLLKFRTWVEVDLDALAHNLEAIRGRLPEKTKICAVVKADAYGHGAVRIARFLEKECAFLAVAMAEEAYELRRAGIKAPIIVLGIPPRSRFEGLIRSDVSITVATYEEAKALQAVARSVCQKAKIHIALDTGMGRIGFLPSAQSREEIKAICEMDFLQVEGIFSHFACADEPSSGSADAQQRLFEEELSRLRAAGCVFPTVHLYNSAATCTMKRPFDVVREGILLYGVSPLQGGCPIDVLPIMTMKSRIIQIKKVPAGTAVSYGSSYVTSKETVIATVSAGYGDGVPRLLSNKGWVKIGGKSAPIIGRICMDQLMVDVTDICDLVSVEDEVVLFGKTDDGSLGADLVMERCGGIAYELLCGVNRRVPRVYLQNGRIESVADILPEYEDTV